MTTEVKVKEECALSQCGHTPAEYADGDHAMYYYDGVLMPQISAVSENVRLPVLGEIFRMVGNPEDKLSWVDDMYCEECGQLIGYNLHPIPDIILNIPYSKTAPVTYIPCISQTGSRFIIPSISPSTGSPSLDWSQFLESAINTYYGKWIRFWFDSEELQFEVEESHAQAGLVYCCYPEFSEDLAVALTPVEPEQAA